MRPAAVALVLALAACGGASEGTGPVEQPDEPLGAKHAQGAPAPAPPPAAAEPSPAEEEAAILKAAKAYVAENVAEGLQYDVELKAREGAFALLFVVPKGPDQDTAIVFMMKTKDKGWAGLDLGTGIECADHVGVGLPQSLCDAAGL